MNKIITTGLILASSIFLSGQQGVLSLEECINFAVSNNILVKKSEVDVLSHEQLVIQRKGGLLPIVNASLSQGASFYVNDDLNTNRFTTSLDLIDASWTVFNGFKNLNTYKKASIDVQVMEQELQKLKDDISLNVTNYYLQVLLNKELVLMADNQLNISNKQLELVNKKYKAGSIPLADVSDAEATVAEDEQALIERQNKVKTAILDLKTKLQLPIDQYFDVQDIEVDDYVDVLTFKSPEEIYEQALTIRPEIEAAKLNVESMQTQKEIAQGSFLPTVSLGYGLGTSYYKLKGISNDSFSDQLKDNLLNSVNASVSIPIFTGNTNKTNKQMAILEVERSQLELENQKYTMQQQIESAYLDVLNAKKSYESSSKTMKARELSLSYAEKRYKHGSINNFDFENAKNNLLSAQATHAQAKYTYVFNVKVLQFYAGVSLWDTTEKNNE